MRRVAPSAVWRRGLSLGSFLYVPGFDDWSALFLKLDERQRDDRQLAVRISPPRIAYFQVQHNRACAVIDAGGVLLQFLAYDQPEQLFDVAAHGLCLGLPA